MKSVPKKISASVKTSASKNGHVHSTLTVSTGNKARVIRKTVK